VRHVIVTAPPVPVRSYADYIGDLKPSVPAGIPFKGQLSAGEGRVGTPVDHQVESPPGALSFFGSHS
jgi:hypothetical protein